MQILNVVLYSRKGKNRIISFRAGQVNLITGGSGTGKSALIDIIEYCLGRNNCNVPEGVIKDNVQWFALRIIIGNEQVFIARENPINQNTSSNIYIETGDTVEIPSQIITHNSNVDSLVEFLTQKMGISENLHTPPKGQTREPLEANIKHALFFCFQQQDEIASKRILFHRQTDGFIMQSIRDTLPYFLGAIQEDRLQLERELTYIKRKYKKAKRELNDIENIVGETAIKATSLLSEAEKVGIVELDTPPLEIQKVIEELKEILMWSPEDPAFPEAEKLSEYQEELKQTQQNYNDKIEQLKAAQTFISEANEYQNELDHQRLRLESIGLYKVVEDDFTKCPLCSHRLEDSIPTIREINSSLRRISSNLETTSKNRPRLKEYVDGLQREKGNLYEEMKQKKKQIDGYYEENKAALEHRDLNVRRARVVGRISLWLESVNMSDNTEKLREEVEKYAENIKSLEEQLNLEDVEEKLNSILNRIGYKMTKLVEKLKLEHSHFPVRLDIKNLTTVVDTNQVPIPLYRMGSGENWVGYHLIAHLALHSYFIENSRPVPHFLILDQPTQVYYPRDEDTSLQGSIDSLKDEDREAVKRMFDLIFEVVKELHPRLQVIITDHADIADEDFQSAVVEKWRDDNALIPNNWLT